jgi:hypothetical protein
MYILSLNGAVWPRHFGPGPGPGVYNLWGFGKIGDFGAEGL